MLDGAWVHGACWEPGRVAAGGGLGSLPLQGRHQGTEVRLPEAPTVLSVTTEQPTWPCS